MNNDIQSRSTLSSKSAAVKKSGDELDVALLLLDQELEKLCLEKPIQVRAIGGYALMKHGVRTGERAYTVDIDTLTRDYSSAVQRAIEIVAEKAGLEPDWLNNDNLGDAEDPELVEAQYDAKWIPQGTGLRNIALSIATVPTLTRAKIIAADTAEFSGRTQDLPDLLDLLRHQGITSTAQFATKYPDSFDEYPAAQDSVQRYFALQSSARIERLKVGTSQWTADLDYCDTDNEFDYCAFWPNSIAPNFRLTRI
ncbi:hypothetical protein [Psychromicrobium sp. YIM B11713]|uniref:hypothetical protein n=1 Tax=Psychromicrobium sp. YIM B11713 TaxID=3145233 RepID=UPI00374F1A74